MDYPENMKNKRQQPMGTMAWNEDLANRFVSDFRLPIPITHDKELFSYYLNTYEGSYGTLSKYRFLERTVNQRFQGDTDKFLKEYYDIREDIIQSMLSNPAYQEFNTMDLSKYSLADGKNLPSSSIYNCGNNGKYFISFDLKKANFQALKYVNPDIVFGHDTYENFVGKFTDLEYVKGSKYTRNVIFGKLNPKRHITVEKFIINEIRKFIENSTLFLHEKGLNLVAMITDELIYGYTPALTATQHDYDELKNGLGKIVKEVKEKLGFQVKADLFLLKGHSLVNKTSGKVVKTFFSKDSLIFGKQELMCVPQPLFPIIYKLHNGLDVLPNDRRVIYEGCNAYLFDDFTLKEV